MSKSCEICDKTFTRKSSLTRHKKIHSRSSEGSSDYKCHLCLNVYDLKEELLNHLKDSHDEDIAYKKRKAL